jgi:hypothetical protein
MLSGITSGGVELPNPTLPEEELLVLVVLVVLDNVNEGNPLKLGISTDENSLLALELLSGDDDLERKEEEDEEDDDEDDDDEDDENDDERVENPDGKIEPSPEARELPSKRGLHEQDEVCLIDGPIIVTIPHIIER